MTTLGVPNELEIGYKCTTVIGCDMICHSEHVTVEHCDTDTDLVLLCFLLSSSLCKQVVTRVCIYSALSLHLDSDTI